MLGDEIKHQRLRLGLSSGDLARLVGVDASTVEGWECGLLRVPRSVRLRLLLGRLEIRHREKLCSPGGLAEWKSWLERNLLEIRSETARESDGSVTRQGFHMAWNGRSRGN